MAQPLQTRIAIDDCASFNAALGGIMVAMPVLAAAERVLERFPQLFQPATDGVGYTIAEADEFFRIELKFGGAGGAGDLRLSLQPSKCFREFVAAIACEADWQIVDVHGWPVLSLVGRNPSVAEAGERSTLPGGSGLFSAPDQAQDQVGEAE